MISLITGVGSRGQVGEAVAGHLARRGDHVVVVTRDASEARARARDLTDAGLRASSYGCDLSDVAQVDQLARSVRADVGDRIDNLVNLAGGFALSGALAESDPAILAKMFQINVATAYITTRAFFPFVRAARGSIVFFASENVIEGTRTKASSAYTAAKSAIVGLMRSVADEGREHGVRANALAPATIRTATNESDMGKDARYVEREDVAAAVAFLCSDAARSVTGQIIRLR